MLVLRPGQMQRLATACFFSRLRNFLLQRARSPVLRQAVTDRDAVSAFWFVLWSQVQAASEHDAALYLTFMLACQAEGLDLERAKLVAAMGEERAEMGMKRFLSERGHLRFSDFDFTD